MYAINYKTPGPLSGGTPNPIDSATMRSAGAADTGGGGMPDGMVGQAMDGVGDILGGLMSPNPRKGSLSLSTSAEDVLAMGGARGSQIGKGIGTAAGAALTPFLGPLGSVVGEGLGMAGEFLGELIGGKRAAKPAQMHDMAIYDNARKNNSDLIDFRMGSLYSKA